MDCLLKVPTRGNNILDWCLVNKPKLFDEPVQLPNFGSSDHFSILINPSAPNYIIRERHVYKRETKDSNVRAFGRWICNDPWSGVFNEDDCQDKFNICHVPVTKPREICTKCFEGLVSNILQGDKMLHFAYFV